jgi:hypothetical protein
MPLLWFEGRLIAGHGVASGQAADSPYPAGSIALQAPFFLAHGIDLSPFFSGTLNLEFSPGEWRLNQPDHRVEQLHWSDRHPPETFSFWQCRLRPCRREGISPLPALIYYPHPETKRAHHQSHSVLEVLAPPLGAIHCGDAFALELDPRRCRLVQPLRLRARLLEFLKFRVLAAQDGFFEDLAAADGLDLQRFRRWLASVGHGEALDLSDADLALVLEQARLLYLP